MPKTDLDPKSARPTRNEGYEEEESVEVRQYKLYEDARKRLLLQKGISDNVEDRSDELQDQIQRIETLLQSNMDERDRLKARLPYDNIQDLEIRISFLLRQCASVRMTLFDERRAIAEISRLRKLRKDYELLERLQLDIDSAEDELGQIRTISTSRRGRIGSKDYTYHEWYALPARSGIYRSPSPPRRRRSRSRSRSRLDSSYRSRSRSRSRSRDRPVPHVASAAFAAAALAGLSKATKAKKVEQGFSRSRSTSRSEPRRLSTTGKPMSASSGALHGYVERARSRSRSGSRSRKPREFPYSTVGLAGAAIAGMFETNKAKKIEQRFPRSRSPRGSVSESNSGIFDPTAKSAIDINANTSMSIGVDRHPTPVIIREDATKRSSLLHLQHRNEGRREFERSRSRERYSSPEKSDDYFGRQRKSRLKISKRKDDYQNRRRSHSSDEEAYQRRSASNEEGSPIERSEIDQDAIIGLGALALMTSKVKESGKGRRAFPESISSISRSRSREEKLDPASKGAEHEVKAAAFPDYKAVEQSTSANETPLRQKSVSCGSMMNQLLTRCDRLPGKLEISDLAKFREQKIRYVLWMDNIGATKAAPKGLDYRLRFASHVAKSIEVMLDDLQSALTQLLLCGWADGVEESLPAVIDDSASSSEFSDLSDDSSTSELINVNDDNPENTPPETTILSPGPTLKSESLIRTIESCITQLLRMSMAVQKKSRPGEFSKLRNLPTFDSRYDIEHVGHKFPVSREQAWLVDRLGQANTRRREHFTYEQRHREKMSSSVDQGTTGTETEYTKATTFFDAGEAQIVPVAQDEASDNGQSETTFHTVVGKDNNLRVPAAPQSSIDGNLFECPYCLHIISIRGRESWKRHVYRDLHPYVCTYKDCVLELFPTRREWTTHEFETHNLERTCCFCGTDFRDKQRLMDHLQGQHKDQWSDLPVNEVVRSCQGRIVKEIKKCPFCDTFQHEQTSKIYRNHVANHLEQVALFALPRRDDEILSGSNTEATASDGNEAESEVDADDEAGRTVEIIPEIAIGRKKAPESVAIVRGRSPTASHYITDETINEAKTLSERQKPVGILREPTVKFPEYSDEQRETVASLEPVPGVPPGAKWTKIDRKLVSPRALEKTNERFEERSDGVIVLRVLSPDEITKLADITKDIRDGGDSDDGEKEIAAFKKFFG